MGQARHQHLVVHWTNNVVRTPLIRWRTRAWRGTGNVCNSEGQDAIRDRGQVVYCDAIRPGQRSRGRPGRHIFESVGQAVSDAAENFAMSKSHGEDDKT